MPSGDKFYYQTCLFFLFSIGSQLRGITTGNGEGDRRPDLVPNDKWFYYDGKWKNIPSNRTSNDIILRCTKGISLNC